MTSSNTCKTSNKKRICVLTGIHASGKSTLGSRLQSEGASFFPEIGKAMRLQTTKNVSEAQQDFDLMVLRKELYRDYSEVAHSEYPVIESWHIGNYAFAKARKSQLEEEYDACFKKQLSIFYPIVIRLHITDHVFLDRNSERFITSQDSLRFYRKVDEYLSDICDALQAAGLATILSYDNNTPESLMDIIKGESDIEG